MDLVGRLPWREGEVIVLHYIADLPVHVMATMLGVSITAVKSRLFRARSRLRTDYLDAEGTRHATE
jgi:RNA polymerase sigma-70 factor (ECF subfamily)